MSLDYKVGARCKQFIRLFQLRKIPAIYITVKYYINKLVRYKTQRIKQVLDTLKFTWAVNAAMPHELSPVAKLNSVYRIKARGRNKPDNALSLLRRLAHRLTLSHDSRRQVVTELTISTRQADLPPAHVGLVVKLTCRFDLNRINVAGLFNDMLLLWVAFLRRHRDWCTVQVCYFSTCMERCLGH